MPEFDLSSLMVWTHNILAWIGFGTVVGLLAKAIMPGRDPGGAIATLMMGIGGTVIGCGGLSLLFDGRRVSPMSPLGFVAATAGAVARVPAVIQKMNDDLSWTMELGEAFLAQDKDVMDAIQNLRGKAQKAGTLQTSPQQVVTVTNMIVEKTVEQQVVVVTNTIVQIQPSNPQVVYVPTYNPYTVYYPPPAYVYNPSRRWSPSARASPWAPSSPTTATGTTAVVITAM